MSMMLRRILRGGTPGTMLVALVLALTVFVLVDAGQVYACWNTVLNECFGGLPTTWPWNNRPPGSGRNWRICTSTGGPTYCSPNIPPSMPRWGINDRYYDIHVCPTDVQAVWCIGLPASMDPDFNVYPPNLNTYMTYGPINLSTAISARVSFWLLHRSELNHDSLFWGAAISNNLTTTNMNWGGSFSGTVVDNPWRPWDIDLANLRNYSTGDSVSMLGQSVVYVFWRFVADGNANPVALHHFGSFVDNVVVTWDDGGVDIEAESVTIYRAMEGDTSILLYPAIGDTLFSTFNWTTCTGGVGIYPDFRIRGVLDETVVLKDTLIQGGGEGMNLTLTSDTWVTTTPDSHTVRWTVDYDQQVGETNENNNSRDWGYWVPPPNAPPEFTWIHPGEDTLFVSGVGELVWSCYDAEEQANIYIYTDVDTLACNGILIPGGMRQERDGLDTLRWDLTNRPTGQVYWVYARVLDAANTLCLYAQFPVVKIGLGATDRPVGAVPEHFFLAQNYPNPFNPATELEYGIARQGYVSLRVYDLLGREVAVLVDGERAPGTYRARFDGSGLSSGLYLYTLTTPEGTESRKMMLMK